MKKAFISGINGQDGSYLALLLLNKGYKVFGGVKSPKANLWRLKELNILKEVEIVHFNLLDVESIKSAIQKSTPSEFYNLASQSSVAGSFSTPLLTQNINANGTLRILETINNTSYQTKFFQASSSEMFGKAGALVLDEESPFQPQNPYAISKLSAHWMTTHYRNAHKLFTASGILFNHESPLRGPQFVTRKITQSIIKIIKGDQSCIELGNLDITKDWGHAKDFAEGMWSILQQNEGDDFVLATGILNSLKSFIEIAFEHAGIQIDWVGEKEKLKGINKKNGKTLIKSSKKFYRPLETPPLIGKFDKAKKYLNWTPKITFDNLIEDMMKQEIKRYDLQRRIEEEVL